MPNAYKMVKKKTKRLATQAIDEPGRCPQASIKKFCTEKKFNKRRKKGRIIQQIPTIGISQNTKKKLNKRAHHKPLTSVQNDLTLYEIKPLSPTKLSISVKKFYSNTNFERLEDNLHFTGKSKALLADTDSQAEIRSGVNFDQSTINNKKTIITKNCHELIKSNEQSKIILKRKKQNDMKPELNKDQSKSIRKFHKRALTESVLETTNNSGSNQTHASSDLLTNVVSNTEQTNANLVGEYQVTHSSTNTLSISVKRFYKSNVQTKAKDLEKVNKDMPLVSDTTYNSKADNIQSPSSRFSSSHKISLNVKHINDSSNNKQQKVTAFFPIRRSARKTKNVVNEEKQKALEKAIISQNEDGLEITVFPDKGRGIIAGRDFSRGEFVVEYAGELITIQEARKRETFYSQDTATGCYMYYFKYGTVHYCIDATEESKRLGRLVNHSRFGNLGPKVVEISGLPRIVLIAKGDIKRGEELTYDYGDRSKESLVNHPWLAC